MTVPTSISVRLNGKFRVFEGRFAWALVQLVAAGARGCTPVDNPAPRWSHYVYRLRRDGVSIEMQEAA